MSWLIALSAAFVSVCAPLAIASVHTYNVGALANPDGDDTLASWLHDSSMSPYGPSPTSGADNRAYRTGYLSEQINGSLYGELNGDRLTGIGGRLTGNLGMLLNSSSLNDQPFELLLGRSISANRTGGLQFETNGAGTGEFTGGFVDYRLTVSSTNTNDPQVVLEGTFFFKPQAETGSTALTPNRGDPQAFTLWGYNYMHDSGPASGPAAGPWGAFLSGLGYTGNVTRSSVNRTLGIALFASNPEPPIEQSINPEPTTFVVWGGLAMIGIGSCRRRR